MKKKKDAIVAEVRKSRSSLSKQFEKNPEDFYLSALKIAQRHNCVISKREPITINFSVLYKKKKLKKAA